jgi:hypothetical protein
MVIARVFSQAITGNERLDVIGGDRLIYGFNKLVHLRLIGPHWRGATEEPAVPSCCDPFLARTVEIP